MIRPFRLEEPKTVREAAGLLRRHGDGARVYAGGTELLLAMKERLVRCDRLINIKKISALDRLELEDGTLRIGALATHRRLEESRVLAQCLPAFVAMERAVANVRVRGVGTLGGNLCFAEPHSDPGTLLLVLAATLVAEGQDGRREIPVENFFLGPFETALGGDEILTEIKIPVPPPGSSAAYIKFGYLERPSVGVALFLALDDAAEGITSARVAVGSAGPQPKRVFEAEALLQGVGVTEAGRRIDQAGEAAARAAEAVSDIHGAADYKEHLIRVLLKRALARVIEDCQKQTR
ncbi:MAG TPA: FAD binding domain-containing protein [Candidatus Acidoferrales bacterium]|nr:FAD binding domain-containing protein [Candidatus Acidoferrales bacterium]